MPSGMLGRVAATALLTAASISAAPAQSPAEFYKGKTIEFYIGYSVGGGYDLYARLIARHIGKHIPGTPSVVPKNMEGASSMRLANWLYNAAPKDGTALGATSRSMAFEPLLGHKAANYDAAKFTWIGSANNEVSVCVAWETSGITRFDELLTKELAIGSTGTGDDTYQFPRIVNNVLGTKFKIVTGYPGGNDVNVAMERGEVGARNNTWSSWKSTKAAWLKNQDIAILVQAGPKAKDLPDVPTVEELAKNEDDRRIIQLIISGTKLGRPLAAGPGVPPERVKAMRAAFDATMKDAEFLQAAAASKIEVDPVRGEDMQKVVTQVLGTPKELVERAKRIME